MGLHGDRGVFVGGCIERIGNNMKKVRIIERTFNGHSTFVIQQKHFLFKWMWVDGWINSGDGANCRDSYGSLEEAKDNLIYFDGSHATEEVVG